MLPTSEKVKVAAARILLNRMDRSAEISIMNGMEKEAAPNANLQKILTFLKKPGVTMGAGAALGGAGSLLFTGDQSLEDRLKTMALAAGGGAVAGSTPSIIKAMRGATPGGGRAKKNLGDILKALSSSAGTRVPLSALLGGGVGAGVGAITDQDIEDYALMGAGGGALVGGLTPALINAIKKARAARSTPNP